MAASPENFSPDFGNEAARETPTTAGAFPMLFVNAATRKIMLFLSHHEEDDIGIWTVVDAGAEITRPASWTWYDETGEGERGITRLERMLERYGYVRIG